MTATDDVLNQADALMRRHRSFVARCPEDTELPLQEAGDTTEADIPVLTEVVVSNDGAAFGIDATLNALQQGIEEEVSAWLVDALPAAVANASQHIIAELDAKARNALLPRLQALIKAHRQTQE